MLTRATLKTIRAAITKQNAGFEGPLTVYGEQSRLATMTLACERILFKHTPYEIKARD